MQVLVVGAGVIGTVYGVQLGIAGNVITILQHGSRTEDIANVGFVARDLADSTSREAEAEVVIDAGRVPYDLVLVCVCADQIESVTPSLRALVGSPSVLFVGNNPRGRSWVSANFSDPVQLAFPGVGGSIRDGIAEYTQIRQQPTTLDVGGGEAIDAFARAISARGFAVARTNDMEGWLLHHAVFIASVSAALGRCRGSAAELADDRATLTLMCRAIEEGFRSLRDQGVGGAPRNLRTLHLPVLRPFAVWYWARTMRSPMGERAFAAHARRADGEMRMLATEVIDRLRSASHVEHLRQLLASE